MVFLYKIQLKCLFTVFLFFEYKRFFWQFKV